MFSFPAQTVRYTIVVVLISVIVVVCVCFVNFHCYLKMAALFVLTFFRISLSCLLFLFVLTRNVIHASVFVVVVLIVICIDGVYFILCCWACV